MTSSEFRRGSLCIEHTRFLEQEFNVGVYRIYIYTYILSISDTSRFWKKWCYNTDKPLKAAPPKYGIKVNSGLAFSMQISLNYL